MKVQRKKVILFIIGAMFFTSIFLMSNQEQPPVTKAQWELEFQRIKELYRLSDLFADRIWPGFSLRKVPIGINYRHLQEVLINHPNPPKEFRKYTSFDLEGQTVMIRDGCTMYMTPGGGGSVPIDRIRTAYVHILEKETTTEDYLRILFHEGFHIFQQQLRDRVKGTVEFPPIYDIQNSAEVALENTILFNLLQKKNKKELEYLAKMFVAVRTQRQKRLSSEKAFLEDYFAFGEGTAHYTEVKLYQLIDREGIGKSPLIQKDTHYNGFTGAGQKYREFLEKILPPKDRIITLGHERYQNGMAQALLLDRIHPNWKQGISTRNETQFSILKSLYPLKEKESSLLTAEAKKRFRFAQIKELQKSLIQERLDEIGRCIDAPGRRYRIFYLESPGKPKFKLRFPVYEYPGTQIPEKHRKSITPKGKTFNPNEIDVLIMVKGLERLEKKGFLFQGKETPVIQWMGMINVIEWIDNTPAADKSDMKIQADKIKNDIYTNLSLTTDGFTLKVDGARIIWTDKIVEIHPLPPGKN